jgi:hypothetical protein
MNELDNLTATVSAPGDGWAVLAAAALASVIAEITGAFVVIRLRDERRMGVLLRWWIEHPFQNRTRHSTKLIGSVFPWVDDRMPVDPLRGELARVCAAAPEWDGRVAALQVTEAGERAMQLRARVSAPDAGRAWDLRCRVREALVGFIQREHPESLPRVRADNRLEPDAAAGGGEAATAPAAAGPGPVHARFGAIAAEGGSPAR